MRLRRLRLLPLLQILLAILLPMRLPMRLPMPILLPLLVRLLDQILLAAYIRHGFGTVVDLLRAAESRLGVVSRIASAIFSAFSGSVHQVLQRLPQVSVVSFGTTEKAGHFFPINFLLPHPGDRSRKFAGAWVVFFPTRNARPVNFLGGFAAPRRPLKGNIVYCFFGSPSFRSVEELKQACSPFVWSSSSADQMGIVNDADRSVFADDLA